MDTEQEQRIIKELKVAGATRHGLAKPEAKELPRILQSDEHIGGIVYGRGQDRNSAMLVATNQRVLFLDDQFLFKTRDEITYEIITGITSSTAGPFTSLTLHTRIEDYTLRYVNTNCAEIFINYVEKKRLVDRLDSQPDNLIEEQNIPPVVEDTTHEQLEEFLASHDIGVLSTIDRTGNVHGAVVYYASDQNYIIHILTKSGTGKAKNIYTHNQVAFTIHDPDTLETVQLQGTASIETDPTIKNTIYDHLSQPRKSMSKTTTRPVTKLHSGSFMVIKITPSIISYRDYFKS